MHGWMGHDLRGRVRRFETGRGWGDDDKTLMGGFAMVGLDEGDLGRYRGGLEVSARVEFIPLVSLSRQTQRWFSFTAMFKCAMWRPVISVGGIEASGFASEK